MCNFHIKNAMTLNKRNMDTCKRITVYRRRKKHGEKGLRPAFRSQATGQFFRLCIGAGMRPPRRMNLSGE